jgi:excinuclease ABC subunit C
MIDNIQKKIRNIPHKPGVYIFKNEKREIVYIGKARDLKNRVSQYYHKENDGRPQIPFLLKEAVSLEHIITDTC